MQNDGDNRMNIAFTGRINHQISPKFLHPFARRSNYKLQVHKANNT